MNRITWVYGEYTCKVSLGVSQRSGWSENGCKTPKSWYTFHRENHIKTHGRLGMVNFMAWDHELASDVRSVVCYWEY